MLGKVSITSGLHSDSITRLAYVLLLMTIFAHVWAASTPLPFGGPNVIFAAIAVFLALSSVLIKKRFIGAKIIIPPVALSGLLLVWATIVYLFTDTLVPRRIGQMGICIGIVLAVYYSVNSVYRIKLMMLAIILATWVSALVGIGIAMIGDPFFSIWLAVGEVNVNSLVTVMYSGRLAGLSVTTVTFSYQLALAIPLVFAVFLYNPLRGRISKRTWDGILYVLLTTLVIAAIANASRSMILGVVCGIIVVIIPSVFHPSILRRLYFILPIVAVGTFIFFMLTDPLDMEERKEMTYQRFASLEPDGLAPQDAMPWRAPSTALLGFDPRIFNFNFSDRWNSLRLLMAVTASRYSLEYPFGTGRYSPDIRHVTRDLKPDWVEFILSHSPHNQFLVILVYYGFPGLALLILFYVYVLRSLIYSSRLAMQSQNTDVLFLVAAIAGGLVAYMINSCFHNAGPFVGDWYHFFLIGLVFSVQRILHSDVRVKNQRED